MLDNSKIDVRSQSIAIPVSGDIAPSQIAPLKSCADAAEDSIELGIPIPSVNSQSHLFSSRIAKKHDFHKSFTRSQH
jgi:hypothetical protein